MILNDYSLTEVCLHDAPTHFKECHGFTIVHFSVIVGFCLLVLTKRKIFG